MSKVQYFLTNLVIDEEEPNIPNTCCIRVVLAKSFDEALEREAPVAVDAEILERFPEINFANYGQDEVEALQAWAFEAYEAIARLNGMKIKNEFTE